METVYRGAKVRSNLKFDVARIRSPRSDHGKNADLPEALQPSGMSRKLEIIIERLAKFGGRGVESIPGSKSIWAAPRR